MNARGEVRIDPDDPLSPSQSAARSRRDDDHSTRTAAAMVAQLEKRGFVVEKITARSSFAETMVDTDPS
jgi:hypothetical protein